MPKLEVVIPRYEGKRGPAFPKNGKFISISNSERVLAACPKRWWFKYSERLDTESGPAARLGTAFHEVMEDIWQWWADEGSASTYPSWALNECIKCYALKKNAPTWTEDEDCRCCDEHKEWGPIGPIPTIANRWRKRLIDIDDPLMTEDEFQEQLSTLVKMCEGYLERWGHEPPAGFEVLGVELTLGAPIMDGTKPFRTNVPVVEDSQEIRLASRVDLENGLEPRMIRWPWYQVGRIDGLLRHKKTGSLWILEHKTSKSPKTYFESLSIDPQTTGYIWMLRSMCKRGLFGEELKNHPNPVAGYMYDVVSTAKQYAPSELKNGSMSLAKTRNTPSWVYREAIKDRDDQHLYQDHLQYLEETVDHKLYQREWGSVGESDLLRYELEMAGVADRHALMRRQMVSSKDQTRAFPRQPVCMRGFCSYKGICVNDTPEGRARYVQGRVQRWKKEGVENDAPDGNTTQVDTLPF
jgi:hypothetical protein